MGVGLWEYTKPPCPMRVASPFIPFLFTNRSQLESVLVLLAEPQTRSCDQPRDPIGSADSNV